MPTRKLAASLSRLHFRCSQVLLNSTIHALGDLTQRDRQSSYEQWSLSMDDALANETALGLATIMSGETLAGAARFAAGAGRHGAPAGEGS